MDMSKTGAEKLRENMSRIGFSHRQTQQIKGVDHIERYEHRQLRLTVRYYIKEETFHLTGEFGDKVFDSVNELDYYIDSRKRNYA